MPLKIRSRIIALSLLLCIKATYSQSGINCYDVDETGIIKKAYNSFENDLFAHYKFGTDSIKTYRTFLAEVASLSIDLRKLPSENSIRLAREFKKIANNKNSLWIKLSEYENNETITKVPPTNKKNQKELLIFNYRGGYIQCLKNTTNSNDFKDLISTLEKDGNVSTSLISQKIYYITDKELRTSGIKNFIAFDIYYSILMVIEKAFN
ncbi:hypothetical protein [Aquimarina aquimarini]|uniref:hypothetical protein n=1 Tax=Aquimarina aquimarini TaxID=1191734 RepID=UPI000D56228A|nr:hypothetical protein [Aquimarina aquimarini]